MKGLHDFGAWAAQLSLLALFAAGGCAAAQPAAAQGAASAEEAVRLETPAGNVHGTLLIPAERRAVPAVLLIAGSGPTNRDGNSQGLSGANNSLKLLAEGLAERGIASLRYDKRGVGESASATIQEADLRFDTYVEDAVAWSERLHKDERFSAIVIAGHSEGSLIGMLAAQRSAPAAFISISGPASAAGQVLRTQLRPQLPPALWQESERILSALEAGQGAGNIPQPLLSLYRPSVQPYMISWLRYSPAREIARLATPVLVAQGTTDTQISVTDAEALSMANPRAKLVVVEGMNHVLKLVALDAAKQRASYTDPSLPVAPELLRHIGEFVLTLPGARRVE
ncbi:MAG: alpha/beta fold hydrolase [Steroidobacteraceae bacterium]